MYQVAARCLVARAKPGPRIGAHRHVTARAVGNRNSRLQRLYRAAGCLLNRFGQLYRYLSHIADDGFNGVARLISDHGGSNVSRRECPQLNR